MFSPAATSVSSQAQLRQELRRQCVEYKWSRNTMKFIPYQQLSVVSEADGRWSGSMRIALRAQILNAYRSMTAYAVNVGEVTDVNTQYTPHAQLEAEESSYQGPSHYPGETDALRFNLHPSVAWWRAYSYKDNIEQHVSNLDNLSGLRKTVQFVWESANKHGAFKSPETTAYWTYHVGRTLYFSFQGFAALAAQNQSLSLQQSQKDGGTPNTGNSNASTHGNLGTSQLSTFVQTSGPRILSEAMMMYWWDLKNVEAGMYKVPWDMTTLTHRQYNPVFFAQGLLKFMQDSAQVLQRRRTQQAEPLWLRSDLYPDYYRSTFHFQTDGWMSRRSADMYELSTETLFVGRQDAMQRTGLVPLARFFSNYDRAPNECHLLELGCGTGRFMTFIKDNYPHLRATALDLSPFYLEKARENVLYWREKRQPGLQAGGVGGTGVDFVQAAAEDCPFEDESVDVVVSVYLFHELPRPTRLQILERAYRVLRPGGMLVLTDSVQLGDRPAMDSGLGTFQKFNEPFYGDYIKHDLGEAMEKVGFKCDLKVVGSTTKSLSAIKIQT